MFNLSIIDNVQFKWLNFIKSIFERTGLNYLWNQQQPVHSVQLKLTVKQNLTDQYVQNWFSQIENSSSGEFYGIFKNEFNVEKYLLKLLPHERNMITKFRCNNIKLPIETGRWSNIPREERICICVMLVWVLNFIFYLNVPLLMYKGLDVNLPQFIILDMQKYTKWKACYLCVMLRLWKNVIIFFRFCNYILKLYYFKFVIFSLCKIFCIIFLLLHCICIWKNKNLSLD